MTQPLQLRQCPGPTGGQVRMGTGRKTSCAADEVGQAGLARGDPVLVDAIAVTDQVPGPVLNSVVRRNGVGDAVEHLLDRSQADRHLQH
jgi:hypothetical protein